jgi:hypothetical protein
MNNQRGSVFFYILIGVALFASLSYAVSQSVRTSAGNSDGGSKEKRELTYVELVTFLENLKLRVYQMESTEGVSETKIDFDSTSYLLGNNSQNCWNKNEACQTTECGMFSPENPQGIRPLILESITSSLQQTNAGRPKNGHLSVGQLIIEDVASPAPEMIVTVAGISPSFCNYYNSKQGITTNFTNETILEDIGEGTMSSRPASLGGCGTSASFNTTNTIGDQYTFFKNKRTFCSPLDFLAFKPTLRIVYVLKAR